MDWTGAYSVQLSVLYYALNSLQSRNYWRWGGGTCLHIFSPSAINLSNLGCISKNLFNLLVSCGRAKVVELQVLRDLHETAS